MIELLGQGKKYYDSVFGEAEIVATAYSNFGNRVTKVKTKLVEKMPELGSSAPVLSESPVPSPDFDAPSPAGLLLSKIRICILNFLFSSASGDEMEIKLPDEGVGSSNTNTGSSSDLNSRLSGINYDSFQTPNKDGYSISEFLTKMAHGEKVDVDSFISGGERKRRRVSGSGSVSGYDPSSGGTWDTPQPRPKDPWSEPPQPPPVNDLLSWVGR